jgi:hypothetical protein
LSAIAETANLRIPLASAGYVQFRQSYTTAMKILSAATGLTLPVVTSGTVVWRANLISNLGMIAAYKGVSLPTPALGLLAMRTSYVKAMTLFDGLIGAVDQPGVPTPSDTYANSTSVYANQSSVLPDLLGVEQRLLALGGSYSRYRVDYGTGPNTATGDTVYAALVKLQSWVAAIETAGVATQENTLAGNTSLLAGNAAWKARFQSLEIRFTALGVA